ncbi:MAG: TVP38/TMEM64 family protein [Syntrophobacterales bacterium]|nr:TVP38/TMEM64 family protein [Syntrophobacterales bacterium]
MSRGILIKIFLLILFILLCIFSFIHFDLYNFFKDRERVTVFINSFGPLSVAIFIGLQILQVLIAPIPGELSGFVGGYLYGPLWGTLYSTIGLSIGSLLAFFLARWLGQPFIEKITSPATIQKYDYFVEHKGIPVIFVLFFIPGFPKDILSYIIGLSRLKASTFLLICATGRLTGTILLSLSGSYARSNHTGRLATVIAVGAVITILGSWKHEQILSLLRGKKKS